MVCADSITPRMNLRRTIAIVALSWAAASCGGPAASADTPSATTEPARTVVDTDRADGPGTEPSTSTVASEDGDEPVSDAVEPLSDTLGERIGSALPDQVLTELAEPLGVEPISVSLPALGVNQAPIQQVGLEPNGELEVPGADAVGWYRFGVGVDAGRGSAVLAAHIAYNGRDGVFRDLVDSAIGDVVEVGVAGETRQYQVVSIDQYGKYDLPIDDLFREDGDERLVLITCGGDFNPNLRSYDDNVVVIAVPVGG